MCCFIPDHGRINPALQLLTSWRWAPLKNGCIVSGSHEVPMATEFAPQVQGAPLGWTQSPLKSWVCPANLLLPPPHSLSSPVAPCCSVWCPSAKQNKLKPLAKAGQMGLQSAVHMQLLLKPGWGGGGNSSICYFQGTSTWNGPPGLVYRVSPLLSSRMPRAHPRQGLPHGLCELGWVRGWRQVWTCLKKNVYAVVGFSFMLSDKDTWHCRRAEVGIEVGQCVHIWRL